MRETPTQPCEWCGYELTGLPPGRACPECGVTPDDAALRTSAQTWFVGRRGFWLYEPPMHILRFVGEWACLRVALRRYLMLFLLPLAVYAAWLCIWSQFAFATTYNRWWELNSEPGVRRSPDQTTGFSLALGEESWRDRPHLPESSLAPWYDGRFYWEFSSTAIVWRPHWPRPEFFVAPAVILAASLACKIPVYWAIGVCAILSSRRVRRRSLWRSAWNLSVAQLVAFAGGIVLLIASIPSVAIIAMYAPSPSPAAALALATLAGVAIQPLWAAFITATISASCAPHPGRAKWRILGFVLLITFAAGLLFASACVGRVVHRIVDTW